MLILHLFIMQYQKFLYVCMQKNSKNLTIMTQQHIHIWRNPLKMQQQPSTFPLLQKWNQIPTNIM